MQPRTAHAEWGDLLWCPECDRSDSIADHAPEPLDAAAAGEAGAAVRRRAELEGIGGAMFTSRLPNCVIGALSPLKSETSFARSVI
jgi:hypothetical protein